MCTTLRIHTQCSRALPCLTQRVFGTRNLPASKAEAALRSRLQPRLTKLKVWWWSNPTTLIKGMPDIQGVHLGIPFFVEWKAEDGATNTAQRLWLMNMAIHGGVGIECRANLEKPRPYHAEYRLMRVNGTFSSWCDITSDTWIVDALHAGKAR